MEDQHTFESLLHRRAGQFGGKAIAAKLERLRNAIGPIGKDRKDAHLNRRYISAKAIAESVREAAEVAGLASTCHQRIVDSGTKDAAGAVRYVTVQVTYVFTDPETGEWDLIDGIGTGEDKGDRATNKAVTYAVKNALKVGLLLVEDSDDAADVAPQRSYRPTARREPQPSQGLNQEQAMEIRKLLAGVDVAAVKAFFSDLGVSAIEQLPADRFEQVRDRASRLPKGPNRRAS